MKLQRSNFKCGIFAIMNALRCFGVKISEKRLAKHTSTTKTEGTSEFGIRNCLDRLNYEHNEINAADEEDAWTELYAFLEGGSPVILSVDSGEHWLTAIAVLGEDRVVVFDSDSVDPANRKEHGTHVWDAEQLFKRWKMVNDLYYGISVQESE